MTMRVRYYDEYSDAPRRGIIETPDGLRAFFVKDSLETRDGFPLLYSVRLHGFDEGILPLLAAREKQFAAWRARFDRREVDRESHPLLTDLNAVSGQFEFSPVD